MVRNGSFGPQLVSYRSAIYVIYSRRLVWYTIQLGYRDNYSCMLNYSQIKTYTYIYIIYKLYIYIYIYIHIYRPARILHSCDYGTFEMAEPFHAICHHNLGDKALNT